MSQKNSEFVVNRVPYLLMTESEKKTKKLSDKLDQDEIHGIVPSGDGFMSYYDLPQHLNLDSNEGATKSFTAYMNDNGTPHEQMRLAAHNVAQAHNYLSSKLFTYENFNKDIFKYTVHTIKNAFNALQKVGQQHNHAYLGDMLDDASHKYNAHQAAMGDGSISEPNTFSDYASSDEYALTKTKTGKITAGKPENEMMENFIDDTMHLSEADRSEFTANMGLAGGMDSAPQKSGTDFHHVFIKNRATGKRKSIAGPFHSPEAAEAHPARKFGDGVCTGMQCENVVGKGTMINEDTTGKVFKLSKTFYDKRSNTFIKRKVPVTN